MQIWKHLGSHSGRWGRQTSGLLRSSLMQSQSAAQHSGTKAQVHIGSRVSAARWSHGGNAAYTQVTYTSVSCKHDSSAEYWGGKRMAVDRETSLRDTATGSQGHSVWWKGTAELWSCPGVTHLPQALLEIHKHSTHVQDDVFEWIISEADYIWAIWFYGPYGITEFSNLTTTVQSE